MRAELGLQAREIRWCNMGIKHPHSKTGFWTRTRVLSSRQLWSGSGSSVACRCSSGPDVRGHADVKGFHVDRHGFRERLWININLFVAALVLSGKPLNLATLCPGSRPELILNIGWPYSEVAARKH